MIVLKSSRSWIIRDSPITNFEIGRNYIENRPFWRMEKKDNITCIPRINCCGDLKWLYHWGRVFCRRWWKMSSSTLWCRDWRTRSRRRHFRRRPQRRKSKDVDDGISPVGRIWLRRPMKKFVCGSWGEVGQAVVDPLPGRGSARPERPVWRRILREMYSNILESKC